LSVAAFVVSTKPVTVAEISTSWRPAAPDTTAGRTHKKGRGQGCHSPAAHEHQMSNLPQPTDPSKTVAASPPQAFVFDPVTKTSRPPTDAKDIGTHESLDQAMVADGFSRSEIDALRTASTRRQGRAAAIQAAQARAFIAARRPRLLRARGSPVAVRRGHQGRSPRRRTARAVARAGPGVGDGPPDPSSIYDVARPITGRS
jgi:hypothetical protein